MSFKLKALCAVGFVFAFLTGCGATGPKFTTPPAVEADKARVFFYRMPGLAGGCCAVDFAVDDTKVAALKTSGYTYFTAAPGVYKLGSGATAVDPNSLMFEDELAAGESYCYRFAAMVGSHSDTSANTVYSNSSVASAVGPLSMSAALSRIPYSDCTVELKDYRYTAPLVPHVQPKPKP
jgi:hypothetical protein